jgi:hypothetical protein
LAEAVEDGRLTEAQQAKIVADLPERIDALVDGELKFGVRGEHGLRADHGPFGVGGPPPTLGAA